MKKYVTNKNRRLKGPEKKSNKNLKTDNWNPPDTAVVPQDDDKIIYYLKSQFDDTMPYYKVGISSTNKNLKEKKP